MSAAEIIYLEQQRRKSSGSFGYGDFGIRKNEDTYMGETDSDDITRGGTIIGQFYNTFNANYPNAGVTLNDLLAKYQTPGNGDLISIGAAAYAAGMTDAQTQAAMDALVAQSGGKLPANWNGFVSALSGQATTVNWVDAATFVVTESASQISTGVQQAATAVQNATSSPWLYIGLAAAAYLYLTRK